MDKVFIYFVVHSTSFDIEIIDGTSRSRLESSRCKNGSLSLEFRDETKKIIVLAVTLTKWRISTTTLMLSLTTLIA